MNNKIGFILWGAGLILIAIYSWQIAIGVFLMGVGDEFVKRG